MNPKPPKQNLGSYGESLAEKWLIEEKKFQVVARNWREGSFTELDLVCIDNQGSELVLVAVEVKTRSSGGYGRGVESITPKKLNSLKRSFLYFKRLNPQTPKLMRLDAVDILIVSGKPDIRYYRNILSA